MISCKMITYGRVHLLVEALHSFLIQDFEDRELVIVNDCPFQKLHFEHSKVRIYNLDKTFDTIGEKENYAIEKCHGDIIAVWDDDDIAMPWHLRNVQKYLKNGNILHWQKGAYYNEPEITKITHLGNSGIVYTKDAWRAIGKSPIENAGGDMTLVKAIHALDETKVVRASPPDEEISWFYRWALPMNYHQSGMGRDDGSRPNIVQRNAAFIEKMRRQGKIPVGFISLTPLWRHDYTKMLKDYVSRIHNTNLPTT